MSTVTLNLLREWSQANRFRDASLNVSKDLCPEHTNYVMDTYKFFGKAWNMIKLDPAGLVSFALWLKDPLYKAADGLLRRQLFNEGHITLRQEFEAMAPSRKRRRMVELFENGMGTNRDGFAVESADASAYWNTWASVLRCQFVRITSRAEEAKRISFIPESPANWSSALPVYYVDEGCETIFLPPSGGVERTGLAAWVADRADDGWQVTYPSVDGTKEELERRIIPLLNVVTVSEKAKKAELAAAIGRHEAIEGLIRYSGAPLKIDADD